MFRNFLRVLLDQRGKNNIVEKQCCLLSDFKHALLGKYFLSAILKYDSGQARFSRGLL